MRRLGRPNSKSEPCPFVSRFIAARWEITLAEPSMWRIETDLVVVHLPASVAGRIARHASQRIAHEDIPDPHAAKEGLQRLPGELRPEPRVRLRAHIDEIPHAFSQQKCRELLRRAAGAIPDAQQIDARSFATATHAAAAAFGRHGPIPRSGRVGALDKWSTTTGPDFDERSPPTRAVLPDSQAG